MKNKTGFRVFSLTSANGFSQVAQFFIIVLLAREYGPTVFGQFSLVLVLANFLAVLFDFGRSTYYTRELAFGRLDVNDFVRESAIRILVFWSVAVTIGLISFLASFTLGAISSLLCATQFTFLSLQALPKGQLKVTNLSFALVLDRTLCLAMLTFLSSQRSIHLEDGLWAWVLGQVAGSLILLSSYPRIRGLHSKASRRLALDPSRSLHLGVFSTTNLLVSLDQAILGALAGVSQLGQYSAVAKWFSPLSIFGGAVSTVISNDSARRATQLRDALKENKNILGALVSIGATLIFVATFGREIVTTILGDKYASSEKIFPLLAISAALILLNQPLAVLLQYFGLEKEVSKIIWTTGAAYLSALTISLLIEPKNGAIAVAIFQIAMQSIIFVCLLRMFKAKS